MRDHRVRSGEVELAVRERGEAHRPTVVLLHGYPDTSAVWDEVAEMLAQRFRVLAYDVRGAGASTTPEDPNDYRMEALLGDLAAVLDAVGGDAPVHLVGHDWGSVQGWAAVTDDPAGRPLWGRIASFTSISGPDWRHVAQWVRRETARTPADPPGRAYVPQTRAHERPAREATDLAEARKAASATAPGADSATAREADRTTAREPEGTATHEADSSTGRDSASAAARGAGGAGRAAEGEAGGAGAYGAGRERDREGGPYTGRGADRASEQASDRAGRRWDGGRGASRAFERLAGRAGAGAGGREGAQGVAWQVVGRAREVAERTRGLREGAGRARDRARRTRRVLDQARRSAYMPVFAAPGTGEALARIVSATFARGLKRAEGGEPRPGHPAPTIGRDARNGLGLYRANIMRLSSGQGTARVPVQLIVPTRDRYATQDVLLSARGHADPLYVRRLPAGHWAARTHPDRIANWVTEFIDHLAGGPDTPDLMRARAAGRPGGEYTGRLVVVTGAGSGIGRATARAFAAEGASVVVADIDEGAAKRVVDEISGTVPLGEAHPYGVDVADPDAMERFAGYVSETFGVPDVVVNNAGIGMAGPLLETGEHEWARIRAVNLDGVYRGCRLFGAQMVARGEGGHLVNLASMAAFVPGADVAAYSATKAAVLQLSECLRQELADEGIGVSAICPGVINTEIPRRTRYVGVSAETADELRESAARAFALRGYPPERVAQAILQAVRHNRPVVPVAAEARVGRTISRLAPSANRALARMLRRATDRHTPRLPEAPST
ncbi:SDR family oxidoreductase [Actinomadura rupiterrae]|uniref:SDR family oxidoreductase n=1 Tax=Actinomadura rupiterrae TaxID=559627 RepID=UPI0020A5B6CE|nr:SDR family oxidoreductase [Actinomadura rupiterrae]MCP2340320.1 NAD(P)-dependent dehydrogenase (short-subunit alcohol dehydrogenase family)/pimeloyl-ACP methyl ester carboxylesterase [Actinomadura rupiterrae]